MYVYLFIYTHIISTSTYVSIYLFISYDLRRYIQSVGVLQPMYTTRGQVSVRPLDLLHKYLNTCEKHARTSSYLYI